MVEISAGSQAVVAAGVVVVVAAGVVAVVVAAIAADPEDPAAVLQDN